MRILLLNASYKAPFNSVYEKFFVKAGSRWPHSTVKKINETYHYLPFPFYLGYTAALLLKDGFDVKVIDAVTANITREETLARIKELKPDVILMETATPTIDYDADMMREVKSFIGTKVVFCGTHATVYYKELLGNETPVDFVVRGEYERAFGNLARAIRDGKPAAGVKGIAFKSGGAVTETGFEELIDPLDSLPYPARGLFPLYDRPNPLLYWDTFCQYRPAMQMHASRGCPYGCYFCLWPQVMYRGKKYRKFSPGRVVDEMQYLAATYGAREIYFDDDDFTIDRRHVLDICAEIKKRKFAIKWSCMGDAINLDEELVSEMHSSGCVGIKFGIETGSPEVLKEMGKPVDLDKVKRVADLCAKYLIRTRATFSFGLIKETEATLGESLEYARGLNVDTVQASICVPYPGTKYFEYASREKLLRKFNWIDFDGKAKEIITHPTIDYDVIERFRSRFVRDWLRHRMMSPSWMFRQLRVAIRGMYGQGIWYYLSKTSRAVLNELGLRRKPC